MKIPIVDICGETIDLSKVERVGRLERDILRVYYEVHFVSGEIMQIFQHKTSDEYGPVIQMPREEFVKLWEQILLECE